MRFTTKKFPISYFALIIFILSLVVRFWGLNSAGNVWDEYFYYDAMRDYSRNVVNRDFNSEHWSSNMEHPPAGKYIYLPSLAWNKLKNVSAVNAYHAPRAISALIGSATVVIIFFIGYSFFSLRIGLISALIYSLLPGVIAYNKILALDTPMIFWWTLAMFNFFLWIEKNKQKNIWLSVIFGSIAIVTKFNAVLIAGIFYGTVLIKQWKSLKTGELLLPLALILFPFVAFGLMVAIYPWLWSDTLAHLLETLGHWGGRIYQLWFGSDRVAPISYFLIFFILETPLLILLLALSGIFAIRQSKQLKGYVLLLWLGAPFLLSFYHLRQDHLRYILSAYPALALIAAIGFWLVVDKLKFRSKKVMAIVLLIIYLGYQIISIHPYYLNYYNGLVGGAKGVQKKQMFEIGFYGEGIKEATEYVNRTASNGATVRYEVIPDDAPYLDRPRLQRLDKAGADYLIFNTNALHNPHKKQMFNTDGYKEVYSVKAQNAPFVWVYQKQ